MANKKVEIDPYEIGSSSSSNTPEQDAARSPQREPRQVAGGYDINGDDIADYELVRGKDGKLHPVTRSTAGKAYFEMDHDGNGIKDQYETVPDSPISGAPQPRTGGSQSTAQSIAPAYASHANPMQGAPQWIQDNQWAARHGSAMPGERNGGSGPAFQSRPQGRGASPYDRYAQSQVPTQRPVYNAVGTTTTMPPRASMPSAGMSQAYGAGTTTYIPARPAQTPVQRTGSQGVSQAGAQQRASMAALTDLATPTQQAGAQAAAQGLQGVPGLERFRR